MSSGVGWDWGDVLDSSDLDLSTSGQGSDGVLGTRSGGLGLHSSSGSELDVDRVDADLLEFLGDFLGGKHGCVRRRLFLVGSDLHTSGDSAVGLASSQIGDVNESIVPGGQNVSDTEDESFALDWGTEMVFLLLLFLDDFLNLGVRSSLPLRLSKIFIILIELLISFCFHSLRSGPHPN